MYLNEEILQKWSPLLDHKELPTFKDAHRRLTTAIMLENTERELSKSNESAQLLSEVSGGLATSITGGSANYDPVLISLVRRAMPNLIAYDVCGVQPMTGPTGLIFALVPQYDSQSGNNAFYYEANTGQSGEGILGGAAGNTSAFGGANNTWGGVFGVNTSTVVSGNSQTYNFSGAMNTAQGEALGSTGNTDFNQMAFSVDKVTVTAGSRALKATYSIELAQDLKAIHGLDAETELSTILSAEILAEINREIIRTINLGAVTGAADTTTAGTFDLDVDSNGRWMVEKFKGMMFQIERDSNLIAKNTRRGKGNLVICSSDVASALQMAGVLDYTPALNSNNLQVDDTGNTFAGVLNNRTRVYVDPYAAGHYMTIGYKGASAFDAGLFYCPYVPLQMVRAVGQDTFQPSIGFKTRYGVVFNPFAQGYTVGTGALIQNANQYYRRILVNNIL